MMTRKQFLGSFAGMVGLAALGACKSDSDDDGGGMPDAAQQPPPDAAVPQPDAPPMMACSTTAVMIGTNHGHTLVVPAADVAAGVAKSYNIKGGSAHPHTVLITAQMFATLKSSRTLMVVSSNDANHTHAVTITC